MQKGHRKLVEFFLQIKKVRMVSTTLLLEKLQKNNFLLQKEASRTFFFKQRKMQEKKFVKIKGSTTINAKGKISLGEKKFIIKQMKAL